MNEYRVAFGNSAEKTISKLNEPDKGRILKSVYNLPGGDTKKMAGKKDLYRLRVGEWRVLYSKMPKHIIFIREILPRGEAYKKGVL